MDSTVQALTPPPHPLTLLSRSLQAAPHTPLSCACTLFTGSLPAVPRKPVHLWTQQRAQGLPRWSPVLCPACDVSGVAGTSACACSYVTSHVHLCWSRLPGGDARAFSHATHLSQLSVNRSCPTHGVVLSVLELCCLLCAHVCCSGIRSSVVQLEASAESLRFITNNSPGRILGGW
jgi:hypothetical protein